MAQWLTRSTLAGGRVESGDRGLASPAKQTPIPRSWSFTEVCTVFSEGWTGLGRVLLAGLRWRGIGRPRARRARANTVILGSGEVERVRRGTVEVPGCFIGAGVGHGAGLALARRGARGGARRACSGELRAHRTRGSLLLPLFFLLLSGQNVRILP
jgi:hypothetical protein